MNSRTLIPIVAALFLGIGCGGGGSDGSGTRTAAETRPSPSATQAATATASSTGTTATSTASSSGARIEQAGLVKDWDPRSTPDPSRAFATTFRSSDKEIDATFKLAQGVSGEVTSAWKYKGEWVVLPGVLKTQAKAGEWTSFTFTPRKDTAGFDAGEYEVILAAPGSAETKSLKFTVTAASSSARFDQAGLVKKWDPNVRPDPSTFTTSFLANDGRVHAVFRLPDGSAGDVSSTWKYGGQLLPFGDAPTIQLDGGRWGTLYLGAPEFPAGDYEVSVAINGTNESRSLRFRVGAAGATLPKPKLEQAGLVARVPNTTPDPSAFVTTFKPTDQTIYALFKLSSGPGSVAWVSAVWKYQGQAILASMASSPIKLGDWDQARLTMESPFPRGDYELVLSVVGTDETKSLKFTIN